MPRGLLRKAVALLLFVSTASPAVTILSGPSFGPSMYVDLAGVLALTTDVETRVSVSVDDGTQIWTREFYDFATTHSIPLFGFKSGRSNSIYVTLHDKQRHRITVDEPLVFVTPSLPPDFPRLKVLRSDPERMEPGFTLFRVASGAGMAYYVIVDNFGEVVWYRVSSTGLDVRQLENGNLFFFSGSFFYEMNLLGEIVKTWSVRPNLLIDSHEGLATDHGTILYLSTAATTVSNYPTSTIVSNAPTRTATNVVYARVIEMSVTNSLPLNSWSMIQLLDPRRITYLTTVGTTCDSEHGNSVIEDPSDNSLIVSLRHQNAVVKFSRAGQLIWILGPHENWGAEWQKYLLTPVGTPFEWQYGQHAALLTPQGTLLLYDNGNYRATPFAPGIPDSSNYSRAVEYQVNEQTMEVSQVWEYGSDLPERLYTDRVGSAEPLPKTGNVLVTFGSVRYVNGTPPSSYGPAACMARIQEVTHEAIPELLFDLAVTEYDNVNLPYKDCYVYRSRRISDIYAHPAMPVQDLSVLYEAVPHLTFSADPARKYTVEASPDFSTWQELGDASPNLEEPGTFEFQDLQAEQSQVRYYRVVTH